MNASCPSGHFLTMKPSIIAICAMILQVDSTGLTQSVPLQATVNASIPVTSMTRGDLQMWMAIKLKKKQRKTRLVSVTKTKRLLMIRCRLAAHCSVAGVRTLFTSLSSFWLQRLSKTEPSMLLSSAAMIFELIERLSVPHKCHC